MTTQTLPTAAGWRPRLNTLLSRAVPDDLIALASRFGVGSIFFLSWHRRGGLRGCFFGRFRHD